MGNFWLTGSPVAMDRERFVVYSRRAGENLSLSFDLALVEAGNGDVFAFICGGRPGSNYCLRFHPAKGEPCPEPSRAVLQREGMEVAWVAEERIVRCHERMGNWEEAVAGLRRLLAGEGEAPVDSAQRSPRAERGGRPAEPSRSNDLAARILFGLLNLDRVSDSMAWWEEWKGRLEASTLANWISPRSARDLMCRLEGRGVSLGLRGRHAEARDSDSKRLPTNRVCTRGGVSA